MLSLLRTGRWLGFTVAALTAIVAFGLLSLWQWHRAEQKRTEFAPIQAAISTPAIPLRQAVAAPPASGGPEEGTTANPREWRHVTVTGRYETGHQLLVRNRPQDGANGFQVVSFLTTGPGDEGVWVVRGFLPASGAAAASAEAPEPPSGEVTVDGYLRASEAAPARAAADVPAGQVSAINTVDLDGSAGVTSGPWYVLASSDPVLRPVLLPEPSDVRNLSYAGQWLLFAAIVVGGWWYFLRREAREDAEALTHDSQDRIAAGR